MIVVSGPRQVGKTTLVRNTLQSAGNIPHNLQNHLFASTDQPVSSDEFSFQSASSFTSMIPGAPASTDWIIEKWEKARSMALEFAQHRKESNTYFTLAIDEIQKIPRWSEAVKGLWDQDRANQMPMHVILLGSSPWLMQKGLTESLAGRYEMLKMMHWSFPEMQKAFDFSLEEYVYFGGYPGTARDIRDQERWKDYVVGSLIQPAIENDILQMQKIEKPSLLKALFELGAGAYSGQIISLTKIQGQLQDAGNVTTLSHYLDLLSSASFLTGLQKYAGDEARKRGSPPKFNVFNMALMSAQTNYTFEQAQADRSHWGRLVESAVGSHLLNNKPSGCRLFYWRDKGFEVDFVLEYGQKLLAIEVKSADGYSFPKGLEIFKQNFTNVQTLIVGSGGMPLPEFLSSPIENLFY